MWKDLDLVERNEYKRMILAFASLTEMFAQKSESTEELPAISPIINSKYQETIFQRVFHATAEDIGNTSYDAAIDKKTVKYLVGIKTFGIGAGAQKIAQFKANYNEWATILSLIRENAKNNDGSMKSKDEINIINHDLYLELAKRISLLRNTRIDSSEANLQGFTISVGQDIVHSVYHVLMPSKKGDKPMIYVGETSYDKINIENLSVIGCTGAKNPTNFDFTDGHHIYRYTSADSQLLMEFDNYNIVQEQWDVIYAEDAYQSHRPPFQMGV